VPSEAVEIQLNDNIAMKVRMIDCVGYLIDGAVGHLEDGKVRSVKTPWSESELPFEKAAEIGTNKVIREHSTIGVVVTTDGSIAGIPREKYEAAEEKVINELKAIGKPFVIALNTKNPDSETAHILANQMNEKYRISVVCVNVEKMTKADVNRILSKVLYEFPVKNIDINLPKWIQAQGIESEVVADLMRRLEDVFKNIEKMRDFELIERCLAGSEFFEGIRNLKLDMGVGRISCDIKPFKKLFFETISAVAGEDMSDEYNMLSVLRRLKSSDTEYGKLRDALTEVANTGYGVVTPTMDEMSLEDPIIVKQGGRFGVKLKASAPSLHIMRVDVEAEVSPIVGTEQQSEDMLKFLLSEFENNKQGIWETNMFGKSLNVMVKEGLNNKLHAVPSDAKQKMKRTLTRIVNEGKGGVVCILL
jgi:stage IV sporulation protein A